MNCIKKQRPNNRALGTYYEQVAKAYLLEKGYFICEMNYRTRNGEVDIIARDTTYTVFVEIKYRKTNACGYPSENVHYYKQQTLRKVATMYLVQHQLYDTPSRFDVIEILDGVVTHIENAF